MKCDQCTEPAMAIAPGTEEIRELFLLSRGAPLRCWCLCHWAARFGMSLAVVERDDERATS